MAIAEKLCSKCAQWLPLESFCRDKHAGDGLKFWCRTCASIAHKRWQAAHLPEHCAYMKARYWENSEVRQRRINYAKSRYTANKEKLLADHKKYFRTEKGKAAKASAEHRRRARKRGEGGTPTTQEITRILGARFCHICGRQFTPKRPATLDHVIPLSKGEKHEISNLAAAHGSCNGRKHASLFNPETNQGILV